SFHNCLAPIGGVPGADPRAVPSAPPVVALADEGALGVKACGRVPVAQLDSSSGFLIRRSQVRVLPGTPINASCVPVPKVRPTPPDQDGGTLLTIRDACITRPAWASSVSCAANGSGSASSFSLRPMWPPLVGRLDSPYSWTPS